MIVRAATSADIPDMADVTATSYAHAFAGILEPQALAQRDALFFRTRFAETWPHMRVAIEDDRIFGVAMVTNGHLDMLFLDPATIGKGVGAALLRDVEEHGARTLECFRDNHAARRFYERHGWRQVGAYDREFVGCQRSFVAYEKMPAERNSISP